MENASVSAIAQAFEALKAKQYEVAATSCKERKQKLKALKTAVSVTFREEIREALYKDFRKPQAETDLTEIFAVTSEINHALKYLPQWMSDRYVRTPLSFLGSSSFVRHDPKGICLIISPWNFPINLCLAPLVSAVAAGNVVMLKPSEHTPHSSAVVRKIVEHVFASDEVHVVEGGIETAEALLAMPFNHIFFTGSPQVGKLVMAAAAKHLTSVTLELGGKSPVIVDETADLVAAARRIAWGKLMNAGQICIAPDYLFVHRSKEQALVNELKKVLVEMYSSSALEGDSYCNLVSPNHANRVYSYLEDAKAKGAEVIFGGTRDTSGINPTLLRNVSRDASVLHEEIFGPILPILTYDEKEEVVSFIRKHEKPLAVYVYSRKPEHIAYFLKETRSGTACINNNDMQFMQPYLPFGGDNHSGIGKAHGEWGFKAFSNERSVYRQHIPSVLEKLMPPYTATKNRVIEWIVKWF